jgi:hypothetical protein
VRLALVQALGTVIASGLAVFGVTPVESADDFSQSQEPAAIRPRRPPPWAGDAACSRLLTALVSAAAISSLPGDLSAHRQTSNRAAMASFR